MRRSGFVLATGRGGQLIFANGVKSSTAPMAEYTKTLVGFYDILGFSEFVRQHADAEAVYSLFSKIRSNFSFNKDATTSFDQRFTHFSDTIVRTTPFFRANGAKNNFGMLFHEILDAASFQAEMIWRELAWVRGSITFGDVYHDHASVFGPAIIQAYKLEQEVAVFPRVIIDPRLLAEFEKNPAVRSWHNRLEHEREHCYELLRRGDDGIWFVDYLRIAQSEADHPEFYPELLVKHKRRILFALKQEKKISRIVQKYTWLAHYHNTVVSGLRPEVLKKNGYKMADLTITAAEAPLYFQVPNGLAELKNGRASTKTLT